MIGLWLPVAGAAAQDVAAVRRLAATANLAAEEYRLGVQGGRVIAEPEVEEARLFLAEARRNALRLPAGHAEQATAALDRLVAMVERVADPDSVERGVAQLVEGLARDLDITLDEVPVELPSLARGREVYQASCASCHGSS
ncbi:MAG TPA: hypothetical protein VJK71_10320, partial [Gemmatimonadales bacterium]|nr:hypothetical protein [Gemmatimonadales bacterium]